MSDKFDPAQYELYRMEVDFGRQGSLEGLFFARPQAIAYLRGREVRFGEALGKHSDVSVTVGAEHIKRIVLDNAAKQALFEACGKTISGHNPIGAYLDGLYDDVAYVEAERAMGGVPY